MSLRSRLLAGRVFCHRSNDIFNPYHTRSAEDSTRALRGFQRAQPNASSSSAVKRPPTSGFVKNSPSVGGLTVGSGLSSASRGSPLRTNFKFSLTSEDGKGAVVLPSDRVARHNRDNAYTRGTVSRASKRNRIGMWTTNRATFRGVQPALRPATAVAARRPGTANTGFTSNFIPPPPPVPEAPAQRLSRLNPAARARLRKKDVVQYTDVGAKPDTYTTVYKRNFTVSVLDTIIDLELRFCIDPSSVSAPLGEGRRRFREWLTADLSYALEEPPSRFTIKDVAPSPPDGVVAHITLHPPNDSKRRSASELATSLRLQFRNSSSRLYFGTVTSLTDWRYFRLSTYDPGHPIHNQSDLKVSGAGERGTGFAQTDRVPGIVAQPEAAEGVPSRRPTVTKEGPARSSSPPVAAARRRNSTLAHIGRSEQNAPRKPLKGLVGRRATYEGTFKRSPEYNARVRKDEKRGEQVEEHSPRDRFMSTYVTMNAASRRPQTSIAGRYRLPVAPPPRTKKTAFQRSGDMSPPWAGTGGGAATSPPPHSTVAKIMALSDPFAFSDPYAHKRRSRNTR